MPSFLNIAHRGGRGPGMLASPGRAPRARPPFRTLRAAVNRWLTGTSRDAAGATLGNVRVLIFRTHDNGFVGETLSDAAGAWVYQPSCGGPFFLVEYLTGSPDLAGTSVNTLQPE